jgi:hypothetical protein
MTPEERLRDVLRSEATTIVPAGDGLVRIRERIARRRRARMWVVPSAAVATAAAVGAFFLLAPDSRRTATLDPAQTPTATAQPSPSASPAPVVPDDGGMPLNFAAIWPFTSQAEADTWRVEVPYAQNALEVGRHFVDEFLVLRGVNVSQQCVSCGVLRLDVDGTHIGDITLGRFGTGFASGNGTQLYTVTAVSGLDLTITSPKPGDRITSPTSVTGRAGQPDEHVSLVLRAQAGNELAQDGAQAGRELPWTADLSWSDQAWSHGAIVGNTRSAKDGSLTRLVAVPVLRGTAAPSSSFAGLVDGHVSLFDAANGQRIRQLTYPPSNKQDIEAAWSADQLAWVRVDRDHECDNELDRLVNGKASKVAGSTSRMFGSVHLSPNGDLLGWVETPCGSPQPAPSELVLTSQGREVHRWTGPSGSTVSLLDVLDDGTLLVATNDQEASGPGAIGVLPAGASTVNALRPLRQAPGCNLASGAAFRNGAVVAFESCGEDIRLARFALSGSRTGADASLKGEPPSSISVRASSVLVQLFGGDTYGGIATYANGRFTTIIKNDSPNCTSVGSLKGCVAGPEW